MRMVRGSVRCGMGFQRFLERESETTNDSSPRDDFSIAILPQIVTLHQT